jgi:hypothetical protein
MLPVSVISRRMLHSRLHPKGGSDPMVSLIAMMKALRGHQPSGSNSRIKNLLMHCGWSWAGATICLYIGKSWFHIVSKRCKS